MALKTFKGGIFPPERKDRRSGLPIEVVRGIARVAIPVNQHFGAPITPLVSVGDHVLQGQKIADASGPMTAPVHASITGAVTAIEPRLLANNTEGLCIVIDADGSDGKAFLPALDPFACPIAEALERVREAGIVGMGGAGFPTHVKLAPRKPVKLVIANGAECEPYLTIDERMMMERPGDVAEGVAITMRLTGAERGIIAVEENKAHVARGLSEAAAARCEGKAITVQVLRTKYPQGGEKMLVSALTGAEVPSGGLPMDVGCVVQNIGTLVALVEAFNEGKPVIERGLAFSGGACERPKNLVVPIGAIPSDLARQGIVDVNDDRLARVVYGGPMMGVAVAGYGIPIQKNTSGVLFLDRREALTWTEGNCIRCGRCMRACSCRLSPALLHAAILARDWEEAEAIGLLDCIECGTCSYVCPARVQLVQRFRTGKQELRAIKQKQKEAKVGIR
jgi:electron transport complex protein RnfC